MRPIQDGSLAFFVRSSATPARLYSDRPIVYPQFAQIRPGSVHCRCRRGFARLRDKESSRDGQCRRCRRPVGRRREGQDRRLALARSGRRRALPGRPQRRAHFGHRRKSVQTRAASLGNCASGQACGHRQWRRPRSLPPHRRDRKDPRPGGRGDAGKPRRSPRTCR